MTIGAIFDIIEDMTNEATLQVIKTAPNSVLVIGHVPELWAAGVYAEVRDGEVFGSRLFFEWADVAEHGGTISADFLIV